MMMPTLTELTQEMKRYVAASTAMQEIQNELDEKIESLRNMYKSKINKCLQLQAAASYSVQAAAYCYYEHWFLKDKVMDLGCGSIGFEEGPPVVVKPSDLSWESVISRCMRLAPEFVKTTHAIDEEKVIAASKGLKRREALAAIGLSVVVDEYFFFRPQGSPPQAL